MPVSLPLVVVAAWCALAAATRYPEDRYGSRAATRYPEHRYGSRLERGLLALYELPRAQCVAGTFRQAPAGVLPGFGPIVRDRASSACTEGVGLSGSPLRHTAATTAAAKGGLSEAAQGQASTNAITAAGVSQGTIASLLPRIVASKELTVELWMRPSRASASSVRLGRPSPLQPILALGEGSAAVDGILHTGCQSGQYALLIGQQGGSLRVDVRAAVYVQRIRTYVCLQVEVAGKRGDIFPAQPDDSLYHVVVVMRPSQPLAVYVNGVLMPALYLAANPLADGNQPLDVQYADWSTELKCIISPVFAPMFASPLEPSAHTMTRTRPGWDGSLHLLAVYASALSEAQVGTNYAAFLRDSAPFAPDTVVNATEDTPVVVMLHGTDPFDRTYSPSPSTKPIAVYVSELPRDGTLHLPHASGAPPLCTLVPEHVCSSSASANSHPPWPWKRGGGTSANDGGELLCIFDAGCVDDRGNGVHRESCVGPCRLCGFGPHSPCSTKAPPPTAIAAALPLASRVVTEDLLPLRLPDGWLWYKPAPNAFSPAPTAESASFSYYASDGAQHSEPGIVRIVVAGVNDAPSPQHMSVDTFSGVPTPFTLQAVDVDSALAYATLVTVPRFGTLHEALSSMSVNEAVATPALTAGARLPVDRWRLVYLPKPTAEEARQQKPQQQQQQPLGEDDVLMRDSFTFRVCDEASACSDIDATTELLVHNALHAEAGETTLLEETAGIIQLSGVDRRGSALHYAVSRLPVAGTLFPCVPYPTQPPSAPPSAPQQPARPPTFAAFVEGPMAASDGATAGPSCCREAACLIRPLAAGANLTSYAAGRLVYVPSANFYNCASRDAVACSGGDAAAAEAARLFFHVADSEGRRSADAVHSIWVHNVNDPPRWIAPFEMTAEALQRTYLPRLEIEEPDGDAVEWDVQLQALHGFISLPPFSLDALTFALGDGTSDRLMRLSGRPSAVLGALRGASYRTIDEGRNDTILLSIADPSGAALLPLGEMSVRVTSARTSLDGVTGSDDTLGVDTAAVLGLWVVIGAVLLLCGVQLFGWLQRCCHPEAAEQAANYRYICEQEAEDEQAAQKEEDAAAAAAAAAEGWRVGSDGNAALLSSPTAGRDVTIRQWALRHHSLRRCSGPAGAVAASSARSEPDCDSARAADGGGGGGTAVTPAMLAMLFKGRPHAFPAAVAAPLSSQGGTSRTATAVKVPPLELPKSDESGGLALLVSGRFGAASSRACGFHTSQESLPQHDQQIEYNLNLSDCDATAPTHPQHQAPTLERRFSFPYRHRHGGEIVLKSDAGPLQLPPPPSSRTLQTDDEPASAHVAAGPNQSTGRVDVYDL